MTASDRGARLGLIAARLSAAGLAARYHRASGGYLVVHLSHGRRGAEAIIDADGCTALHYWTDLAADPAEVAGAVAALLDRVTAEMHRPDALGTRSGKLSRRLRCLPASHPSSLARNERRYEPLPGPGP